MQLVFALDFSKSNEWTGEKCYRRSLHDLNFENPYMKILRIFSLVANRFDDDNIYPIYKFGDINTRDKTVVALEYPATIDPNYKGLSSAL